MGIQDSIFDVESALEGKPEAQDFDTIVTRLAELERQQIEFNRLFNSFRDLREALETVEKRVRDSQVRSHLNDTL